MLLVPACGGERPRPLNVLLLTIDALRAWIGTSGAAYRPQELLPETEEELRALGYLD